MLAACDSQQASTCLATHDPSKTCITTRADSPQASTCKTTRPRKSQFRTMKCCMLLSSRMQQKNKITVWNGRGGGFVAVVAFVAFVAFLASLPSFEVSQISGSTPAHNLQTTHTQPNPTATNNLSTITIPHYEMRMLRRLLLRFRHSDAWTVGTRHSALGCLDTIIYKTSADAWTLGTRHSTIPTLPGV